MLYVFSKLVWVVVQPGDLLVLLLALGVVLLWLGRRSGRALVTIAALGFAGIALLPLGQAAIAPLEDRFPQPTLPARVDGIILLGGAVSLAATAAHGQVALNDAAERITETLALARRFPAARVLLSGGDPALFPGGVDEAEATRNLLVADGLDAERLLLEDRSRNTWENAVYGKALAQPRPDEVWLLVTSAYHMPRAVGCFRQASWTVLPYPVDYNTGAVTAATFSLDSGLHLLDMAAHEWAGLTAYRVLGRTDALFPAPISSSTAR